MIMKWHILPNLYLLISYSNSILHDLVAWQFTGLMAQWLRRTPSGRAQVLVASHHGQIKRRRPFLHLLCVNLSLCLCTSIEYHQNNYTANGGRPRSRIYEAPT